MRNYFTISEFCIVDELIKQEIADKILLNFISPLNSIRHQLGVPLTISKRSGYRPVEYELFKGRPGDSEHTFTGKGAADLTCSDMKALANLLAVQSPFTRIAYYPDHGFFHVDYKAEGKRFYIAKPGWREVKMGMFLQYVK